MSNLSNFLIKRQVIEKDGKEWSFRVYRKSAFPDLRGYVCLGVRKDGMEEWVPEENVKVWKKIFDSINEVKQ